MMRMALAVLIVVVSVPVYAQTPDHRHIVQRTFSQGAWTLTTREGVCAFVDAAVKALHQHDEGWGHLRKEQPRNGCYGPGELVGHAIDTAYHKGTRQTVDFVKDAGDAGAGLSWGISGTHMDLNDWLLPDIGKLPIPGIPTPPPFDPTPVYTQIAELRTQIAESAVELEALQRRVQMQQLELEHLRAGLDLLSARPVFSTCSARVLGIPVSCRLEP